MKFVLYFLFKKVLRLFVKFSRENAMRFFQNFKDTESCNLFIQL
jgi:hypothetical protein